MAKKLVLVDGTAYLYRAYHALPPLTSPKGEPTGAVYGVGNMLKALLKKETPDYFAVVFDAPGKTFRHQLYPQYKAHRPPMPDDLKIQSNILLALVKESGYPMLQVSDVEADDVIGTLARRAEKAGLDVLISTGDKDLAQLISKKIKLVDTMKNQQIDAKATLKKFGVRPEQMIDYLSLVGDTSDNIPGVSGVGPKTAAKWLEQYSDLDTVISLADEITGKAGNALREALPHLPLYRDLVTIRCDVELDCAVEELVVNEPQTEQLVAFYKEYGFSGWLSSLSQEGVSDESETSDTAVCVEHPRYQLILTENSFGQWLDKLTTADYFALDIETTSLDYMQAEIVGLSFAVTEGDAVYLPVAHDYFGAPQQLERGIVLERLKPLLENPDVKKIGHNIKYDIEVLANYGIHLDGVSDDTMLESYVYNSVASHHNLDDLATKYLNKKTISYETIAGKGVKQQTFNQIAVRSAGEYAAEDAHCSLRLHQHLYPQLKKTASLKSIYRDIEMPLLPIIATIERNGVLVDAKLLSQQGKELEKQIKQVAKQVYDLAGHEFNIASPKQIQTVLFEEAGLPVIRKTPKGQPSTAEDVLQELALEHELANKILRHRSLSKLKTTYTDKLPKLINAKTGRVHTSYHQAVTATGRLSSTNPNLQNIPIRTAEGRRIRQAFIARRGYRLLAADYSQIEMRIMAHLSQDKNLLKVFADGADIHQATAAEICGCAVADVKQDQRRIAKAINFGLIYGMSPFGLSKQLGIDYHTAADYVENYFARYPDVKQYMEDTRSGAHKYGYVETIFGRRLYLPEINVKDMRHRQYAERTAINAPMQGSAADLIKRAMVMIAKQLQAEKIDAMMIMQVHDELVLEVAADQSETVMSICCQNMEQAGELTVPLQVSASVGDNWDEAH